MKQKNSSDVMCSSENFLITRSYIGQKIKQIFTQCVSNSHTPITDATSNKREKENKPNPVISIILLIKENNSVGYILYSMLKKVSKNMIIIRFDFIAEYIWAHSEISDLLKCEINEYKNTTIKILKG